MPHWVSDHQGIEKSPPSGWEAVRHEKDGRRAWVVPLGESVNHEGTTAPSVIDAVRRLSEQQDAGTRAWLPILDLIEEVGEPPSAVVEPQKHSLDSLISAYRQVTSREAATLALGIVDALIELGSLSPGTQHGDLRTDRIYLAPGKDGKPDFSLPRLGPPVGRVNRLGRARSDAQALGQTLAALLTQDRKTSHLDKDNLKLKHQVPTALRERWITLVNDLLDGDYDRDDWGRLRNDLSSLQSAGRPLRNWIVHAAILLLVLGGIASAFFLTTKHGTPSVSLTGIRSGERYEVSTSLKLKAKVDPKGQNISRVQFKNGDNVLATVTISPYEHDLNVSKPGKFSVSVAVYYGTTGAHVASETVYAEFVEGRTQDPVPPTDPPMDEKLWGDIQAAVSIYPAAFDQIHFGWAALSNTNQRPNRSAEQILLDCINSPNWIANNIATQNINSNILVYVAKYNLNTHVADLLEQPPIELQKLASNRVEFKKRILGLIDSRDNSLHRATEQLGNLDSTFRTDLMSALTNRLILLQEQFLERTNSFNCDVDLAEITISLDLMPLNPTNECFVKLVKQITNLNSRWSSNAAEFNSYVRSAFQTDPQLTGSISDTLARITAERTFLTSFVSLTNQPSIKNYFVILTTSSNQVVELQNDAKKVGRSRELLFKNGDIQMKLDLIGTVANWEQASNAVAIGWSNYVANTLLPYWNELQLDSKTDELARAQTSLNQFRTVGYQDLSGNKTKKFIPENSAKWNKSISWYFTFLKHSKRLDGHDTFRDEEVEIPFKLKEPVNLYRKWPNLKIDIEELKELVEERNVELEKAKENLDKLSKAHEKTGKTIVGAKDSAEWTGQETALGSIRETISRREVLLSAERGKIPVIIYNPENRQVVAPERQYSPNEAINVLLSQYGLRQVESGLEISDRNKGNRLKNLELVRSSVRIFTNSVLNKIENLEFNDKAEWKQTIEIAQKMVDFSAAESRRN